MNVLSMNISFSFPFLSFHKCVDTFSYMDECKRVSATQIRTFGKPTGTLSNEHPLRFMGHFRALCCFLVQKLNGCKASLMENVVSMIRPLGLRTFLLALGQQPPK